jgi:hypothetical protein
LDHPVRDPEAMQRLQGSVMRFLTGTMESKARWNRKPGAVYRHSPSKTGVNALMAHFLSFNLPSKPICMRVSSARWSVALIARSATRVSGAACREARNFR